jgi:hypothetical protein
MLSETPSELLDRIVSWKYEHVSGFTNYVVHAALELRSKYRMASAARIYMKICMFIYYPSDGSLLCPIYQSRPVIAPS